MFSITLICMGKLKERFLYRGCGGIRQAIEGLLRLSADRTPECRLPEDPNDAQIAQGLQKEAGTHPREASEGLLFLRPDAGGKAAVF